MFQARELRRAMDYGLAGLDEDEVILTAAEFAEEHGYSKQGIRSILSRGKIPRAFKIGNVWYVPKKASIIGVQYKKKPK